MIKRQENARHHAIYIQQQHPPTTKHHTFITILITISRQLSEPKPMQHSPFTFSSRVYILL